MKKKYSILFDSFHLYHLPQFEPLIELLAHDDRFMMYHSTSRKIPRKEYELCSSILNDKPGEFIAGDNEEERKKKIRDLDLDVFICGWSRYDIDQFVNEDTIVGMAYHGIGIKPSYWRDNHDRLDIRFVEGPYRMDQLRKKGIETDLALTGFMKLDHLFQENKIDTDPLIDKFNLDTSKKTILFAPTFYPSSFELIAAKLGDYTSDHNLLIKPHLWTTFMNKFAGINHKKQRGLFNRLADSFDHVHLIPPEMYNITPFYKISDLLITEASSTIYEMLAIDKPVLVNRFYKLKLSHRLFKNRLYRARLNEQMEKEISEFCFEANQPNELSHVIDEALNKVKTKMPAMENYKGRMLFQLDGKASLRVRDEILKRLKFK